MPSARETNKPGHITTGNVLEVHQPDASLLLRGLRHNLRWPPRALASLRESAWSGGKLIAPTRACPPPP
jgi:hypothetical protein